MHSHVIELRGPSFGVTYGPSMFELIPYAIIDNAVKYAPGGTAIHIGVEDGVTDIRVKVRSFGPYIETTEEEKIFERGYRGIHATRTSQAGTGIGLNTAKQLIEDHFSGSISFTQEAEVISRDRNAVFATQFEISVPSSPSLRRKVFLAR